MIGSAGTLVAATLIAGAMAAPVAQRGRPATGQDREARGAAVAAARAAKAGIDWKDCPADWGLAKPIQCGWVTVPLDYAKPYGKQIKLAVDRIGTTGTKDERQGALVYNPGGPGGSGMRFPARVTTKNPLWTKTCEGVRLRGLRPARRRPLRADLLHRPAGVRQGAQGRPGPRLRGRQARPAQARQGVRGRLRRAQRRHCCRR